MTAIAALAEDCEGPANGTAVSTANSIFDALTGTGTSVFTTTDPFEGTNAIQVSVAAQNRSLEATFTAATVVWFGFAIKITTAPSAVTSIVNSYSAGTLVGNLRLNTARTLQFRDSATDRWTSTTALALDTWYQIRVRYSPTADTAQVKIYDADGTLLEASSATLQMNVAAATTIDEIRMGILTGSVTGVVVYDSLLGDDASEPAVFVAAPAYLYYDNGTTWVEAELYLDNGTTWELVEPGVP